MAQIECNHVKIKYAKGLNTVGLAVRWLEQALVPSWARALPGLVAGAGRWGV